MFLEQIFIDSGRKVQSFLNEVDLLRCHTTMRLSTNLFVFFTSLLANIFLFSFVAMPLEYWPSGEGGEYEF